ncbi:MAG: hypothetical protein V4720_15330, partial [Pseudomonadota bacterium]
MAPRTPKDSITKPEKVAKAPRSAKAAGVDSAATPAAAVVGSDAPAARADTVKLKDLIESVASATGGKKGDVKAT